MPRHILTDASIHPSIHDTVAKNHRDIVDEVIAATKGNDVVIVGMAQNPHPRRARKLLAERKVPFAYLEYGSYVSEWRRRTALKMWTGWPTFPMVFVKGTFIGGASELKRLAESGELDSLLEG